LWSKTVGGIKSSAGNSTVIDSTGNLYVGGYYNNNTSQIDLGNGVFLPASNINNTGTISQDAFLIKYSAIGVAQWVRVISGGSGPDSTMAVKVDSSNNVYIVGQYSSTSGITIATGVTLSSTAGTTGSAFLIKYDSNGVPQFAKTINGVDVESANCLAIDSQGSIYLGGHYTNPSANPNIALGNNITLPVSQNSGQDGFLVKYNSAGTTQWAKTIYGSGVDTINGIAIDSLDNVIICGSYASSTTVELGNLKTLGATNGGSTDGYLVKYDSAGTAQWANKFGISAGDFATSVATDSLNNIYIGCQTSGSGEIDFGNGKKRWSPNSADGVLVKYNSSGLAQWVKAYSTNDFDSVNSVITDSTGNVYITGTIGSASAKAAFFRKLDTNGNEIWAHTINGTHDDRGFSIAVNLLGHVYITGLYRSTAPVTIKDIDTSGVAVDSLNVLPTSGTLNYMFLVKYSQ
jgi:hypothetical protein